MGPRDHGVMAPALPQSRAWSWGTRGPALLGKPGGGGGELPAPKLFCKFTAGHLIYKLFLLLLSNSHKPKK